MPPPQAFRLRGSVNVIYCEAKCPDEDVFYFGSDDEQYDSPAQRKRRYELAGQRFLNDMAPHLLTASLKGPFERAKGWKNPWASNKQSTCILPQLKNQMFSTTTLDNSFPTKTQPEIKQPVQEALPGPLGKSECHLPSPQSLKTASIVSDSHPFLEDEELRAVQSWCHDVQKAQLDTRPTLPEAFSTPSYGKRKGSYDWLKTTANKKRRSNIKDTNSSNDASILFSSPPADLGVSASTILEGRSVMRSDKRGQVANTHIQPASKASPRESFVQLISPPKQISDMGFLVKSVDPLNNEPRAQESKDIGATATLSSPISFRIVKQEKSATEPSALKHKAANTVPSAAVFSLEYPDQITFRGDPQDNILDGDDAVLGITDVCSAPSEMEDASNRQSPTVAEKILQDLPVAVKDGAALEDAESSDAELTVLSQSPELSSLREICAESSNFGHVEEDMEYEDERADSIKTTHVTAEDTEDVVQAIEPLVTVDTGDVIHGISASFVEDDTMRDRLTEEVDDSQPTREEESRSDMELDITDEDVEASTAHMDPDGIREQKAPDKTTATDPPMPSLPDESLLKAAVSDSPASQDVSVKDLSNVQSVAAAKQLTQNSPEIRQKEATTGFSLGAMLRSLVPGSRWAQLKQATFKPTQASRDETLVISEEEERVLPSIETTDAEKSELIASDTEEAENLVLESKSSCDSDVEAGGRCSQINSWPKPALDSSLACQQVAPQLDHTAEMSGGEQTSSKMAAEGGSDQSAVQETETGYVGAEAADSGKSCGSPIATDAAQAPTCSTADSPAKDSSVPVRDNTRSPCRVKRSSEPLFAFKSFAAFGPSSPERWRVAKRRRNTPGSRPGCRGRGLGSILSQRAEGGRRRTNNRVTWAALPGEEDEGVEDEEALAGVGASASGRRRGGPSSPPPRTPLAELPTAPNDKFSGHFSSVVNRTDGLRHRFHVVADVEQRAAYGEAMGGAKDVGMHGSSSRGLVGGADKGGADSDGEGDAVARQEEDVENRGREREATLSAEPMDMVEDMMNEMGDFWQVWDVDAELNAASKKTEGEETTAKTQSRCLLR